MFAVLIERQLHQSRILTLCPRTRCVGESHEVPLERRRATERVVKVADGVEAVVAAGVCGCDTCTPRTAQMKSLILCFTKKARTALNFDTLQFEWTKFVSRLVTTDVEAVVADN